MLDEVSDKGRVDSVDWDSGRKRESRKIGDQVERGGCGKVELAEVRRNVFGYRPFKRLWVKVELEELADPDATRIDLGFDVRLRQLGSTPSLVPENPTTEASFESRGWYGHEVTVRIEGRAPGVR